MSDVLNVEQNTDNLLRHSMNATMPCDVELIAQLTIIGQLVTLYVLISMVILSLIGNTLNIVVFCQRKFRASPCSIYLLFAAYFNLLWTAAAVFSRALSTYNLDFSSQISSLCKVRHFTFYTSSSLSIWMMVLSTFDRFLISSPSANYRRFSSFTNAYRLIGVVTFLLCANYSNLFYCANISGIPPASLCTSITTRACGFYNELSRLMTAAILPGCIIFVFGMGTVRHLKKARVTVAVVTIQNGQSQYRLRKTDRQLIQ
ncbi:unnamed protein product, partial [Rotaria sp. Silwood2]